jgi:uroporphyrinogen III methyltransferase/synthase
VEPDVVPERAVAESLVDALGKWPARRALVVRGAEGRDVLPDALRKRGAEVDVVALYETVAEPLPPEVRDAAAAADYLLFASGSSVRFYAAAGGALAGPRLVSIGPATTEVLRAHGFAPDLEADPHTPDGLLQAVLDDARSHLPV